MGDLKVSTDNPVSSETELPSLQQVQDQVHTFNQTQIAALQVVVD